MAVATDFAEQLRLLREAAGISQYELAKRSGLTKQAISAYEKGIREPAWAAVKAIARALGVSLAAFDPPTLEHPAEPARPLGKRK